MHFPSKNVMFMEIKRPERATRKGLNEKTIACLTSLHPIPYFNPTVTFFLDQFQSDRAGVESLHMVAFTFLFG
jgi:hypothetical protein